MLNMQFCSKQDMGLPQSLLDYMWYFPSKISQSATLVDKVLRQEQPRPNAGQNPEDSCVRLDVALVECLAASTALPDVAKFQECYAATAQSGIPPGSALDECSQYVSSMRKHLKQLGLYPVK